MVKVHDSLHGFIFLSHFFICLTLAHWSLCSFAACLKGTLPLYLDKIISLRIHKVNISLQIQKGSSTDSLDSEAGVRFCYAVKEWELQGCSEARVFHNHKLSLPFQNIQDSSYYTRSSTGGILCRCSWGLAELWGCLAALAGDLIISRSRWRWQL